MANWKTFCQVWAVITPRYGIELYASHKEATRASNPQDIITAMHVMQETDRKFRPLFPEEHRGNHIAGT